GTHGLWPGRHSRVPLQRELILPRGTRYRIKRAAINSEGILHLYADVLLPTNPPPSPEPEEPAVDALQSQDANDRTLEQRFADALQGPGSPGPAAEGT
ncbi:hypothetical protein, partial [Nocardiopsis sp. CNT312]|uniref:hypothetical protein n=1 Tax=Nocardiopsis sp. CNT312 TaxID=1137268 RepID=UPI000565498E